MKFNILNHIPTFEEDKECERCGQKGSRCFTCDHFTEERLCGQCACNDVFEQMNEKTD